MEQKEILIKNLEKITQITIKEYAKKWDRDENNNFAIACYDNNSVNDLISILNGNASTFKIDIITWGLTCVEEWQDAIKAALNENLDDLRQEI